MEEGVLSEEDHRHDDQPEYHIDDAEPGAGRFGLLEQEREAVRVQDRGDPQLEKRAPFDQLN